MMNQKPIILMPSLKLRAVSVKFDNTEYDTQQFTLYIACDNILVIDVFQ